MELLKIILSGNFEFGKEKTYKIVYEQFLHRLEVYYKNDLLISEEAFDEEKYSIEIPKMVVNGLDKSWKNTINFLEFLAQFAISGKIYAWKIEKGKLSGHHKIEPNNDKITVQSYIKGIQFSKDGNNPAAINALNKAIRKNKRHAQAYERRGFLNYKLNNFEEAMEDFTKCIEITPYVAEAFLGRAKIYFKNAEYTEAIEDLKKGIKAAIPHQEIYWQCRKMKGECHFLSKEFEEAVKDLGFFTKRIFEEDNSNYKALPSAYMLYGKALTEIGEYGEAVKMFNKSGEFEPEKVESIDEAESFLCLGLAKRKAGLGGYEEDFLEASELGSKEATKLLEEIS